MMRMLIILVFISCSLLFSCSEASERPLSMQLRVRIDSLAKVYNDAHIAEYDSICQTKLDSLSSLYFDSIYSRKLLELQKLNR